jgi:2-polyprenyl-3-methyl-5-hydroxy-6-metoxy-1,4-benzoquinol methylase
MTAELVANMAEEYSGGENRRCILCDSTNVHVLVTLTTDEIIKGYERMLRRSIASEFRSCVKLSYCCCGDCDLRFFLPAISGSENFYELLQTFDWYYLHDKPEYALAARWITPSDSVLELGCGAGNFAKCIGPARYTGIEFSSKAVQMATKKGLHVLAESAARHAEQHPQDYDVVCSFQVMEHVSELRKTIADCLALLKPNGRFMLCVPSGDSFFGTGFNNLLDMPPHHISHWSDNALRSVATVFRLDLLHIEHEMLAEFHRRIYLELLTQRAINRFLGRPNKLLDGSATARVVARVSAQVGKFLVKGFDDPRLFPRGHSVMAVYSKP